eukprot:scaffold5819_cov115-Isochrysis_galbana.AAC.4
MGRRGVAASRRLAGLTLHRQSAKPLQSPQHALHSRAPCAERLSDRRQARLLLRASGLHPLGLWLRLPRLEAPPAPAAAQQRPGRRFLRGRGPLGHDQGVQEYLGEVGDDARDGDEPGLAQRRREEGQHRQRHGECLLGRDDDDRLLEGQGGAEHPVGDRVIESEVDDMEDQPAGEQAQNSLPRQQAERLMR